MSPTVLTILSLCVTSFAGFLLGGAKFKGISLGVGGVLFAGLITGHFLDVRGIVLNAEVLAFVREFGLILFIYSMGLQIGPNVFSAFRKNGWTLNALALAVVLLGCITAIVIFKVSGVDLPTILGLVSGAVTNTPSLASGQQILTELGFKAKDLAQTSLAYALAYPFAILGSLFVYVTLRFVLRVNVADEVTSYEFQKAQDNPQMEAFNVVVNNPNFNNIEIGYFSKMVNHAVVVSRMKRGNEFIVPNERTKMQVGDVLLLFGPKTYFSTISLLFQLDPEQDLMVESADQIHSTGILVTRPSRVGIPLKKIMGGERHHWVISRIIRHGISLPAQPDLKLAFGDEVIVVGRSVNVLPLVRFLGNSSLAMNLMRFVPFFVGMTLGILVGLIPIHISGISMPLRLGTAGGPLIVALLLSYRGSLGRLIFYMPPIAIGALKDFGIIMFLAVVGIASGGAFFKTVQDGQGVTLIGYGFLITVLPLLIVGIAARVFLKMNYLTLCGALSGSITNLPGLTFVNNMSDSDAAVLGYATVYPLTTCLRIIAAQILALLLVGSPF